LTGIYKSGLANRSSWIRLWNNGFNVWWVTNTIWVVNLLFDKNEMIVLVVFEVLLVDRIVFVVFVLLAMETIFDSVFDGFNL